MENVISFQKKKYLSIFCFKHMGIVFKMLFNLFAAVTFFSANAQTIKWDFGVSSGTSLPLNNIDKVSVSPVSQKNDYGTTTMLSSTSASSG